MHESFANFDHGTCSWRTLQPCLFEDSISSSVIWPRQAMTVNGIAYLRAPSVHHIGVIGSGLLPTPGANDWKGSTQFGQRQGQLDELIENLPNWIKCPCCDDYMCTQHWPLHVHECACPAIDEWGEHDHLPMDPYTEATAGHLSPMLSEWMMGFPIGWTDCAR